MQTALFIGRFQPFHKGHLNVIKKILEENDKIIIIIGSAQKSRTDRNPFTVDERAAMIVDSLAATHLAAAPLTIIPIDDINDPPKWADYIIKNVPPFTRLYTGSKLNIECFQNTDKEIIKINRDLNISGTEIRKLIQENKKWEHLVPQATIKIIKSIL